MRVRFIALLLAAAGALHAGVAAAQALLGGHVMAQSDATGWARHVEAGTFRLLVTFGEQRTKWNAPTAKEQGIESSEDYAKWAAATFAEERATIARVGLLAK